MMLIKVQYKLGSSSNVEHTSKLLFLLHILYVLIYVAQICCFSHLSIFNRDDQKTKEINTKADNKGN